MPPRRRSSSNRRSRSRGGSSVWTSLTLTNQSIGVGAQTLTDALGAFTLAEKQQIMNIKRVVGTFRVRSASAGSIATGRYGLVKVTDDALAASAVPDPLGDLESDWLLNHHFYQEEGQNIPFSREIDNKSGRTLRGFGQTLAWVLDNSSGSTASIVYAIGLRFLLGIR